MIARAAARGRPADGGVGMQFGHQIERGEPGVRSVPWNRVDRCHTFAVESSTGSGS